jgi:hypothetical protein
MIPIIDLLSFLRTRVNIIDVIIYPLKLLSLDAMPSLILLHQTRYFGFFLKL